MGIAHLLIMAMAKEGVSHAEAVKKIWMVDSKGLIVKVTIKPTVVSFLAFLSCRLYLSSYSTSEYTNVCRLNAKCQNIN